MGGLILMILKLSREGMQRWVMFFGFQNYGWLLLVTVVQGAVIFAASIPGLIMLIIGAVMMTQESGEMGVGLMVGGGILMFVLMIPAVTLTNFALYLVADRRGTFGEAFSLASRG